jgi:hypothetical protein
MAQVPPPTLECSRVLEYAILDEPIRYSGHSNLFVGDKEVGPVPCLAICQRGKGPRVFLFHCDRDWTILGTSGRDSLHAAKDAAERIYPGVSSAWIDAHITEEDAAKHINEIWGGGQRCVFCKRTPTDFENPRFIQKNDAWICDSCVRACYELLQSE